MFHLLNGLYYLHNNNIIHCDIKPQNLMINQNNILKIIDFGSAKDITYNNMLSSNETIVTLLFRAPELLLGSKQINEAIDIWVMVIFFVCYYLN